MNNQQVNSTDYLNQIAPQPSRKIDFLQQKPIMIGLILIAVLAFITVVGLIIVGMSGGTTSTKRLAARLSSTENTVTTAAINIKGTKLRALNSELKIYLTNTIRDINPILEKNDIDIKKIDKKVLTAESNEEMLKTLEDARLNAIYDRTYAREMAYQLDTILSLMRQIASITKDKDYKNFLNNAIKNLEPTQKQFADYNSANS